MLTSRDSLKVTFKLLFLYVFDIVYRAVAYDFSKRKPTYLGEHSGHYLFLQLSSGQINYKGVQ